MWYELASNLSSLCLNLQSERLVGMQGAQQVSDQQGLSTVLPQSVQQGAGQGALLRQGMQHVSGQQNLSAVLPRSVQQGAGQGALLPQGVQQDAGQEWYLVPTRVDQLS